MGTEKSGGLIGRAIAAVAKERYDELRKRTPCPQERTKLIEDALWGLKGLSDEEHKSPNYDDPWSALLYLTWYQPRQIHLAASIVKDLLERPNSKFPKRESYVVDIGSGSFATLIGTAMAYATLRLNANATVAMIEPSEEMRRLGKRLRRFLVEQTARQPVDTPSVSDVFHRFLDASGVRHYSKSEYFLTLSKSSPIGTMPIWIMMIHAIYNNNALEMQRLLDGLRRRFRNRIFLEIVTGKNPDLMQAVSRRRPATSLASISCLPGLKTDAITRWRRGIADELSTSLCDRAKTFLTRPVPGRSQGACYVIRATRSAGV